MLHTLAGGAFCTHGTAAMAKVYPWACMSKPTMASSATLAVSAAHLVRVRVGGGVRLRVRLRLRLRLRRTRQSPPSSSACT